MKIPKIIKSIILMLLASSLTSSANAQDFNVSISGASYAPIGVGETSNVQLTATASDSQAERQECTLISETVAWSVLSTERSTDGGVTWSASTASTTISPSNTNPTTLSASFGTIGKWRVKVKAVMSYNSNCGNLSSSGEKLISFEVDSRTPTPEPPPGNQASAYEFDKDTAITVFGAPASLTSSVSPGEKMIFRAVVSDYDRVRTISPAVSAWQQLSGSASDFKQTWTITGEGDFNSLNSTTKTRTITSGESGNVIIYTQNTWNGTTPIIVKCKVEDLAPNPTAPDIGGKRDPDVTVTWTISKRGTAPTTINWVAGTLGGITSQPQGVWLANGSANYVYKVGPDIGPAGSPDYENQTILETFSPATAVFTMNDLTTAWKNANLAITTPDAAAAAIFNSSYNSTFAIDNTDRIRDSHTGFGDVSPFTSAAITAGIGYTLPQQYRAGSNLLGSYSIERKRVGFTTTIKKTGP